MDEKGNNIIKPKDEDGIDILLDQSSSFKCSNTANDTTINKLSNDIYKYPYNGKSPYLIDEIYMIGYEKNYLEKQIKRKLSQIQIKNQNKLTEDNISYIKLNEKPIVLRTMSSLKNDHLIDDNCLIDLIFPQIPKILLEKQSSLESNIVFSFHVPINSTSMINHIYYAHIQHEIIKINKTTYYCPYGICFLSNYPYFPNYRSLAQYILKFDISAMPREFFLYHILHLPSPINISYSLHHFPLNHKQHIKSILFKQLSGYPLIQFDLEELFTFLPLMLVIKIFIITFLEIDILFFSKNLDILNITMHCFYTLNYPLNHSTYFNHIVSVSWEEFKSNTSPFVLKPFSSMLGVHEVYQIALDPFIRKRKNCFIVDIDNKTINYKYNSNQAESNSRKTNYLWLLLDKVFEERNQFEINQFEQMILNLQKELEVAKVIDIRKKDGFIQYSTGFFEQTFDENNNNQNAKTKMILQSFYHFSQKVIMKILSLHKYNTINNSIIHLSNDVIKFSTEEDFDQLFYYIFSNSSKYCIYFENFIQNKSIIDTDIIPLTIFDLFAYKKLSLKSQTKIRFDKELEVIDSFYRTLNNVGIYISLQSYFDLMKSHLQQPSILQLLEWKTSSIIIQETMEDFNYYKYSLFINNLEDDKYQILFPFNSVLGSNDYKTYVPETINNKMSKESKNELARLYKYKKNLLINHSSMISHYRIQEEVEANKIVLKEISRNEKVICSFIFVFIISRDFIKEKSHCDIDHILLILESINLPNLRVMITFLILMYLNKINKKLRDNDDITDDYICFIKIRIFLEKNFVILDSQTIQKINDIQLLIQKEKPALINITISDKNPNTIPLKYINNFKAPHLINNRGFKTNVYNAEAFLILAENVDYDGVLLIEDLQETIESNKPHWSIFLQTQKVLSVIYSPLKLYKSFNSMAKLYIHNMTDFSLNIPSLIDLCSSLHFYIYSLHNSICEYLTLSLEFPIEKAQTMLDQMIDYLYMVLEHFHKDKS